MPPAPDDDAGVVQPEPQPPQPEPDFDSFPAPPPKPGSTGRVLGGGPKDEKPSNLKQYENTVIIGADGPRVVPTGGGPETPPPTTYGAPDDDEEEYDDDDHDGEPDLDRTQVSKPQQPPPSQKISQEIIDQAKAEAEQIMAHAQQMVEQAQMQAAQIVNDAMAQAQQAAEEARQQAGQQGYQEGMEAGLAEGRQAGETQLQEMIEALKFQFVDLVRLRRKGMLDMEPEIVKLSWEIAKRVVGDELKSNREVIVGIVRSALATLGERDEILIRVNPQDFETVKGHQKALEAMIEGLKKFVIQADGAIEPGSCSIETNLGNVDARIETQFEAIRLGLEEMTNIRQFERGDQVDAMPVEVPGDPDFEQRMKERGPVEESQEQHHGHGHHGGGEEEYDQEYEDDGQYQQQEMELLPEPTEELFAQLTPEQQQEYLEAYHQQQEYLAHLQAQQQQQEMELLPEPTEELFAQLTPEQQQEYMEAYQQQQAYLQQMQEGQG